MQIHHYDPYEFNLVEVPGHGATQDQLSMLYTRYALAESLSHGKDVLEIGCGPGIGLPLLAGAARSVVAADKDAALLRIAQLHLGHHPKVKLMEFDAESPPLPDASFDLLLIFETIYFLRSAEIFLKEAHRILRPGGKLLISTVNPEWESFHPTPFASRYFNFEEINALLLESKFRSFVYGAFPFATKGTFEKLTSHIKRTASSLGVIPESYRSKERLKRLFYGELSRIPTTLTYQMYPQEDLIALQSRSQSRQFRILYAVGEKPHDS